MFGYNLPFKKVKQIVNDSLGEGGLVETALDSYYTSAQVDTALEDYYTSAQVDTELADYTDTAAQTLILASHPRKVRTVATFTPGNQDSAISIPANARVSGRAYVATAFDGTTPTASAGHTASATALFTTSDIDLTDDTDSFQFFDKVWHSSASVLRVAIANAGSPSAGSLVVEVEYTVTPLT